MSITCICVCHMHLWLSRVHVAMCRLLVLMLAFIQFSYPSSLRLTPSPVFSSISITFISVSHMLVFMWRLHVVHSATATCNTETGWIVSCVCGVAGTACSRWLFFHCFGAGCCVKCFSSCGTNRMTGKRSGALPLKMARYCASIIPVSR